MESNNLLLSTYGTQTWHSEHLLNTIDVALRRGLTLDSPRIKQPSEIKVALKPHQLAVVHNMIEHEKKSMTGIPYKNSLTYTNYGVIGDEVGSGKSLSVLAFIAYKKANPINMSMSTLYPYSKSNFFTICKLDAPTKSTPSLIVVPHTIYRQWQEYCKKQTTLNVFYAKSSRELNPQYTTDLSGSTVNADFKKKFLEADIVLVSNTLYQEVHDISSKHSIVWNSVFIDEADSIYISGGNSQPYTPFTWFITATWPNFLAHGSYIRPSLLDYYQANLEKFSPELGTWLKSELGVSSYSNSISGRVSWFRVRSTNWLKDFFSSHILRGINLIYCSAPFLAESQKMPGQIEETLLCEQPASHRAVLSLVGPNIQNMIHGGNIEGALAELGVSTDTPMNLVEAATHEREKELDRLKKTLAFKETMDYATPASKETALNSLKTKIASIEEQLKVFRDRLIASTEDCPICYEDPKQNSGTLTPCCHRIFCGQCILSSLTRRLSCPLCRAPIQTNQLVRLVDEKKKKVSKKETPKLLSKSKQLIKFLTENPEARVLVFSRYENPFVSLEKDCENVGITYHTLRGNKDVIANTVKSFEAGEKRVLFLPTQSAGAGLNLVSASHVVLLHAMTPEEEKQVVGRAYRLGRQTVLKVVKLLHEGEQILN